MTARLWLLFAALVYSAVRGINEAMTMHLPGVREHQWFIWYHQGRIVEAIAGAVTAVMLWEWVQRARGWYGRGWHSPAAFLAGLCFLAWECFELSYFAGRVGQAAFGHENILGFWAVSSVGAVTGLHAARVLVGLALVWKGGKDGRV